MRHVVFPLKNPPKPLRDQPFMPWVYAALRAAGVVFTENHIKREIQPLIDDLETKRLEHIEWEDRWFSVKFLGRVGMLEDGIKANQELIANADEGINLIGSKESFGIPNQTIEMLMESISEGVIDSLNSTSGDSFAVLALVYNAQQGSAFVEVLSEKLSVGESNSGSPFDS